MNKEKITYPTKCMGCNKIFENVKIKNYVVRYETWEAYNCCSEGCAKKCALQDGIESHEIKDID